MKLLKNSLEDNELIVQMEFAKNYSCQSLDEIQSAYWNQTTITLHPTVIYYKQGQELKHKSLIFVSDEQRHNALLVFTFMKELIPHIREVFGNIIGRIHYWTDSPTSQYRTKRYLILSAFTTVCFRLRQLGHTLKQGTEKAGVMVLVEPQKEWLTMQ